MSEANVSKTLLKVDDIHVYYGSIHAIKGISFEVNEGEIVTLIGANGAGKSTTLNTVSGLLKPRSGVITFEGRSIVGIGASKVVGLGMALCPEGRRVFQQMTVRDILDADACAVVVKENQLAKALEKLGTAPEMVVTNSQVFGFVSKVVPESIPLTSFSILMARYKGFLETAVSGAAAIKNLNDGDKVLISEGCTHHRQCGDIGSVKLPALLKKFTGKELEIVLSSGRDFPEDLSGYSLVIHCGGCMLNEREMTWRRRTAQMQDVPFTNYGTAIALMNGILKRSLGIFPALAEGLE